MGRGAGWVRNATSTAAGVGLGSSITGFFLGSGQKYLQLSKVIEHLDQRFRSAGDGVAYFGSALGHTVAETGSLIDSLGDKTNTVTRSQFQRYAGFARERGLDPGVAMDTLGTLERVTGEQVDQTSLIRLLLDADKQKMGEGRFAEHVRATASIGESQLRRTGHVDLGGVMTAQGIPGIVFGQGDPRAQGQAGADFLDRLSGVIGGEHNNAMRTYMMRAMGFGEEGGPGYIEMRKRLEAGVHGDEGTENILDLFKQFRGQGLGEGAMFRRLEVASGGSLKAHEIEALVQTLGTDEGLSEFFDSTYTDPEARREAYMKTLSAADRARFEQEGFVGLGKAATPFGASAEVELEGLQMKVGGSVAKGMLDIRDILVNSAEGFSNLLNVDWGPLLTDLTGALKTASEAFRKGTEADGELRKKITEPANILMDSHDFGQKQFDQGNWFMGAAAYTPMGLRASAANRWGLWGNDDDDEAGGGL